MTKQKLPNLIIRNDLASEQIGGALIIINHETGQLITLDTIATYIWGCLKKATTTKEVWEKLVNHFDRPVKKEFEATIKTLSKTGLIRKAG